MLQHLSIENFAIIESLTVDFDNGMTVLTGETGAGKSIIIDAVSLLVGGRGATDFIRYGTDKFSLIGIFYMPNLNPAAKQLLEELNIDFADDQLLIRRDLYQSGKNVIKVNGKSLTVALLRQIGQYIVDIHGQNEHQSLMQASNHLDLLDRFAGQPVQTKKQAYQEAYQDYRQAKQDLDELNLNDQEVAQRIDLLKFQIEEIDASQLKLGEEEDLLEQRKVMQNYQKLADNLGQARLLLMQADANILDQLAQASQSLEAIADIETVYNQLFDQMQTHYYGLQELSYELTDYLEGLTYDPQALDMIEERLNHFNLLKRKYGPEITDVISYGEAAKQELAQLENKESHQEKLAQKVADKYQIAKKLANQLHLARQAASQDLNQAVNAQLAELYMAQADFQVNFDQQDKLTSQGLDSVEFYIATNPGEPLKPLVKVASGGELSRLMLAMKTIFQQNYGATAIIFDEVDTGVSGRVAQAIANKMFAIAIGTQVLCISHLPQVAAMADHHLYISKTEKENRTVTSLASLAPEERVDEVARMITGDHITDSSRQAAREQLEESADYRQLARGQGGVSS
ncbi:DNA repair protein RecN [Aerococcus urinaehominis]|uniref:DNA repair protein RecN n=1 Tax=Aerococcus urinaehominis TaxID=128944 RepID=A0A0X8FLJ7_9LACT|nr:DNA repair protein RecN [Aerococcus urinaehominis]AMB98857.1 DNA repair protein RecN [Aerococcus urinaehominis]SDM17096.1 DNA replication and repair protein RecN [Aerococcus urinaehominis]